MGTVKAMLGEGDSVIAARSLRGPGKVTGPALSDLPSELARETYIVKERGHCALSQHL